MYEMEGASAPHRSAALLLGPPTSRSSHHHPAKPWRTPVDSVLTARNGAIPGWLASSKCPVASSGCRALALANNRPWCLLTGS